MLRQQISAEKTKKAYHNISQIGNWESKAPICGLTPVSSVKEAMEPLMVEPSLLSEYSRNCSLQIYLEQISLECLKVISFAQSRDYFLVLHYYATRYTTGLKKKLRQFFFRSEVNGLPLGDKDLLARVFSSVNMYFL